MHDHEDVFMAEPIQFIPVKDLSDWIYWKNYGAPCMFFKDESTQSMVCLVPEFNMAETINGLANGKINREDLIQDETVADAFGFTICDNIDGNQLKEQYKHALLIADKLHLSKIPPVLFVGMDSMAKKAIGGTLCTPFGDLIVISHSKPNTQNLTATLAHELRHAWQHTNSDNYFTNYLSQAELGPHDFMMQKEEIDAEAFACSYLTELGFDGMEYSISPELFPDLHQAVRNRMNEIMAEAVAS